MRPVKRPFVALVACASLVASGLAAPMMHVHGDAHHVSAHHAGRVVHSHDRMHGGHARHVSHGPGLENVADDEDARSIDLFQMVAGWSHPPVALPAVIASPPGPPLVAVTLRLLVQHSHDPPIARTDPSRAPPAFLS